MGPAWCWGKRGVRTERKEAELSVASRLLEGIDLRGRLVTGDALFAQKGLCQQVIDGCGDYLWVVKRNQATLYEGIGLLFRQPPPGEAFGVAEQTNKHGDRVEVRKVWSSSALEGYLDWPWARQVCKVQREVVWKGKERVEVRFGITSLGADRADGARLLKEVRGHWAIENRLHYVRDVTMGEDASQERRGSAPQVMAALRNTVLAILRGAGATNIAAALRQVAWTQGTVLPLLALPAP
jgi:predicted transposase YbfD/YdcC